MTTTPDVPERRIVETLGLVAAETLHASSVLRDVGTAVRDVVGGRASAASAAVSSARQECLAVLTADAARMGADAVVGLCVSISAATSSVFVIAAQGTAVRLDTDNEGPRPEDEAPVRS